MAETVAETGDPQGALRKVDPPADVPVKQWFTSKGSARWHRPVMTKTQKRRHQRMLATLGMKQSRLSGHGQI